MKKSYAIIFEIDGVLMDSKGEAIPSGVVLFNMLVTQAQIIGHALREDDGDHEIPYVDIVTNRPERDRSKMIEWCNGIGMLEPRAIHMREDLDMRPPHIIKQESSQNIYAGKGEEVLMRFESDPDTVEAFTSLGVSCYQSNEIIEKPQSLIHLNS